MKVTQHREYYVWRQMFSRCYCPAHVSFHNYGGRGITVCKRWRSFANFLADMGDRPEGLQLDRINNCKGYSPKNCRWATTYEQYLNKRTHGWNKLTSKQARAIRVDPRRPYRVIAADYGVTRHMVGMIIRGDAWKEV
jgi:hypothetical protein